MPVVLDNVEMMAIFGKTEINTNGYKEVSTMGFLAGSVKEVQQIVRDYHVSVDRIRNERKYTDEGKKMEVLAAANDYLVRLVGPERLVASAQLELQALRDKLTINPNVVGTGLGSGDSGIRDLTKVLREQEVRALLQKVGDKMTVREIFLGAIDNGDQLTFDAVRNAPSFAPLVSKDALQEGEQKWTEKRDPALAKEVRDLTDAISMLQRVMDVARKHIRSNAGLPKTDSSKIVMLTGKA